MQATVKTCIGEQIVTRTTDQLTFIFGHFTCKVAVCPCKNQSNEVTQILGSYDHEVQFDTFCNLENFHGSLTVLRDSFRTMP